MAVFNSIIPGNAWSQVFQLPAGAVDFAGGETLRASFRKNVATPVVFSLTELSGIVRAGNDYTVGLTGVQTALLPSGKISFDLYADKAGVSRALGIRIHVPVVDGL